MLIKELATGIIISPGTHSGGQDDAVDAKNIVKEVLFHVVWNRLTLSNVVNVTFWGNPGMPDPDAINTGRDPRSAPLVVDPDNWQPIKCGGCNESDEIMRFRIVPADQVLIDAAMAVLDQTHTSDQMDAVVAVMETHGFPDVKKTAEHLTSFEGGVATDCKYPFYRAVTDAGGNYHVSVQGQARLSQSYECIDYKVIP